MEEYPYPNFLFWDISGEILGAIISLGLGYIFAETWEEVAGLFGAFSGLLLALLAAIVFSTLLMQKIRQHRRANTIKNEANDTSQMLASKTEHDTDDPLLIPQMKRP